MRTKIYALMLAFTLLGNGMARAEDPHATEHGGQIFHAFHLDVGGGTSGGQTAILWDFDGWIGTDENKLWLKSEGEHVAGETEQAEIWAMYSRNISTFWDLQVGIRHDRAPTPLTSAVFGIEGLAPYFFETSAHVFISEEGSSSLRLHAENEFLVTQRIILKPFLEADFHFQSDPTRERGAGLSSVEAGLQLRHEIRRKLAPYIELKYERLVGQTASYARAKGEHIDVVVGTMGLRLMF